MLVPWVFIILLASGRVAGMLEQRFDGSFNNLILPSLGSAGRHLQQNITPTFADFTYRVVDRGYPSARDVSQMLFRKPLNHSRTPNQRNLTAFFAFFGQVVTFELLDTDDTTCPVELLMVPVPRCDPDFDPECKGDQHLPYERIAYDKTTGQSPNVPRKQVNKATSYIDGSFVYGNQAMRALYLKEVGTAKMASGDGWYKYPEKNKDGLPFIVNPDPIEHRFRDQLKFWKSGDKHVHENPALLSISVLFFRYHNFLSETLSTSGTRDSHEMFTRIRHWVIAALQNIIVYEWVPLLTGRSLPPYTGYKSNINPDVTSVFDAAAVRYILTLIPAGIQQRTTKCEPITDRASGQQVVGERLCNSFWRSQDILERREDAVEEMLLGMITQLAEADDTFVVEDLQSKFYGPLHFSRQDFVTQTIMRGRDYGLSDYNSVREQMGLGKVTEWGQINPWLNRTNPEMIEKLKQVYTNLDSIDIFAGGMFETTPMGGPGELFSSILIDQFTRIRDGDRFWFENTNNGLFTPGEINEIRAITMMSVLLNSTKIDEEDIGNKDAFLIVNGPDTRCTGSTYLYEDIMEPCTPHKGFDYFAGSEGPYIVLWTSFGLIPFLCLFVAYILSKCKKLRHDSNVKKAQRNITEHISNEDGDQLAHCPESISQHKAMEWVESNESRPVVVRVKFEYKLLILNLRGKTLRGLDLIGLRHVHITLSSNKHRNMCLIKVPKEYDVILQFTNEEHRNQFVDALKYTLNDAGCSLDITEEKLKYMLKKAFTRRKRNQLLERFFKTVFAEAFQMDYDPTLDTGEVETRQNAELLEIELTKEEFASALAMKPNSEFVENMFALMDVDQNGYISFREFLNAIVMLSKGSGENKLQTLFRMFDLDHSGTLDKDELFKLFSSLLEMANSALTKPEIENLVESICQQQGITSDDAIDFNQFCTILSPHTDKLWNAGLEWKGCKNYIPAGGEERKKSVSNLRRLSTVITNMFNAEARKRTSAGQGDRASDSSMASILNSELSSLETGGSDRKIKFMAIRETYSPLKAKIRRIKHFIENNRQHIFFLLIFFGICAAVFAERFYFYLVEREHSGLRALMSYGISITRGASAGMAFSFSLLLLTMLRNTTTFLRATFLNLYVPFDSIVSFHKVVAWTALFFTAVHVLGYGFNFYNLAMQPTKYLCMFDTVVFRADMLPSLNFWFFQNVTGVTGILLVIVVYIIYIFATQTSRRLIFSAFWLSHKLIAVLYLLIFLHGASMIVQKPLFYWYFVGPAVLFIVDKMVSLSRKRIEIKIVRAENLASDVTFIEFKRPPRFEYKSGQWVRIACVGLGGNEYHPFTLTSAPHEDTLSVHIRAVGPWTHGLRNIFDPERLKDGPYPMLFLDGPYGAGQQDWYTYDVSILVGAGIGVTPYASILKDFVHMTSIKSTYKIRCQKVYFIWVTGSQRHFEWLLDILQEVEEIDQKGMVAIDIFITQFFQNFDLRTAMLYVCEEHFQKLNGGRSVFTSLKANTHFGRPHLPSMFQTVHKTHPLAKKIGVFSCGPPGVTKSVERACVESSRTTKALFEHHYENF